VTLLEREILEQPEVLRRRLAAGPAVARVAEHLFEGTSNLVIAARGTSDNVARYAQYLLAAELSLLVSLATPSAYASTHHQPRLDGAAVLAISQSGASPDIVRVVEAAVRQGRPAAAVTNERSSPLARAAREVLELYAGPERSVAATKTYMASLAAVVQLVEARAPDAHRQASLRELPQRLEAFIASELAERARFAVLRDVPLITVAGRGLDLASACETALKLRELTGIACEAFSPPDLLHGPIAALSAPGVVWLVDSGGTATADLMTVASVARRRGMTIVAVSCAADLLRDADIAVRTPAVAAWAGPFFAAAAAQIAALTVAEARGVDVDVPNGLTKITLTH
jgi:glucosamine--fructose-6-phosphate aminotransferase (isomerizing)